MNLDQAINIEDLHRIAKRKLPRIIFDYIEGGVEDERGLSRNEAAFHKHQLLPVTSSTSPSATSLQRCSAAPIRARLGSLRPAVSASTGGKVR